MNWIEEMVEGEGPDSLNTRIGHDTWNLKEWLRKILIEAKAQGTQEALAKVEHWIARYPKIGIETTDLLHYLQQLKDNRE